MAIKYDPKKIEEVMVLIERFKNGELGKLLEQECNGRRGEIIIPDDQDSEIFVHFNSVEETPTKEMLESLITKHFRSLGYVVESISNEVPELYEAKIYCKDRREAVFVVINTLYRMSGSPNKLRMTCHYE